MPEEIHQTENNMSVWVISYAYALQLIDIRIGIPRATTIIIKNHTREYRELLDYIIYRG